MMTSKNTHLYRYRALYIPILTFVLLFVMMLIGSPHAIEYGLKHQIREQGNDQVTIEDIDFNPFTGTLTISQLKAGRANVTRLFIKELSLYFTWHKLFQKQLVLSGVSVHDANLVIEANDSGQWNIAGITINPSDPGPPSEDKVSPWGIEVELLEFQEVGLKLITPELNTQILLNELQLNKLTSVLPEEAANLRLDAQWDDSILVLDGKLNLFSDVMQYQGLVKWNMIKLEQYHSFLPDAIRQLGGKGEMSGTLALQYATEEQFSVNLDGNLSLEEIQLKTESASLESQSLAWKGHMSISSTGAENDIKIALTGDVNLQQSEFASTEDITAEINRFGWSGNSVMLIGTQGTANISLNGKTNIGPFSLISKQHSTDLRFDQASWEGGFTIPTQTDPQSFEMNATGDLTIQTFAASSPGEDYTLMAFDKLVIHGINADTGGHNSIDDALFDSLALGKPESGTNDATDGVFAHCGSLSVASLQYSSMDGVIIDQVQLNDVTQTIKRSKEGEWNAIRLVDIIKTAAKGNVDKSKEAHF